MIRDRLVVGLKDFKLSEKFQLDPKLTLEFCRHVHTSSGDST